MTRQFDLIAIGTGSAALDDGIAVPRSGMAACDRRIEVVRRDLCSDTCQTRGSVRCRFTPLFLQSE